MAERDEARYASSKRDGPNYKSDNNTARPTVAEIEAGAPGTAAFVVHEGKVYHRSNVPGEAGPGSGRGIFDGEEKQAHEWRGQGASPPLIEDSKKPTL